MYRTPYHGTGGRPVGSLTTVYNNVPPITITIVYMGLRWVSRIIEQDVRSLCRGKHCGPLSSNI